MAYAPPSANAVGFVLKAGYSAPVQGRVDFTLGESTGGRARRLYVSVGLRHRAADKASRRADTASWERPAALDENSSIVNGQLLRTVSAEPGSSWGGVLPADGFGVAGWASSKGQDGTAGVSAWDFPVASDRRTASAYDAAEIRDVDRASSLWAPTFVRDAQMAFLWELAKRPSVIIDPPPVGGTPPYVPPPIDAIHFALGGSYAPPLGDAVRLVVVGNEGQSDPPAYLQRRSDPRAIAAVWGQTSTRDRVVVVRWGHGPQHQPRDPPPVDIPHGGTNEPPPIPPSHEVYLIMNDVQVVVLPERTPLDVESLDIETSIDTWCWSLRMDLVNPSQLRLLKPTSAGPKSVEVTVNGYPWTFLVEGRDRSREHESAGGRTASVTGRSQTALLSDNYSTKRSLVVDAARTAQQLAIMEIGDRALPFNVSWDGIDWLVPAGVWTYQDMAPIDVISQIAAARGAVVQSAPADAQVNIRARYPTSPWAWTSAVADIALPLDWVVSESGQQQSKPVFDAVFVLGQQQGVMARVTRQGAAGETWASQVVDLLIVTPEVAVERGRNVLSDRGMQDLVQVTIPLFPAGTVTGGATGLYAPLQLVDVKDPDDPYQALSVGVSIAVRRSGDNEKTLEVWQSVSLERHLNDVG